MPGVHRVSRPKSGGHPAGGGDHKVDVYRGRLAAGDADRPRHAASTTLMDNTARPRIEWWSSGPA
ncbi:hypothetical protein KRM28CT15_30340 [Krasilnikovia sp. M28-CT-15]